jgi:putative membrane protein
MTKLLPPLRIGRQLVAWLLAAAMYVALVGILDDLTGLAHWAAGDECAALLAFALGILLVFRTNTAYDRWWEARKQWGQLVNDVRNLALKTRAYAAVTADEIQRLDDLLIAFPHSLKLHLRGVDVLASVPGFADDCSTFPHPPGYIAGAIHQTLGKWNRDGRLADTVWLLDIHARSLLDICGACERIRNTPLASSYRSLVRWGILLYALLAPWSVSLDTGWTVFPVLMLTLAFLFGMELTAEVIEEPFGTQGDDLPLDDLCATMERFVRALPPSEDLVTGMLGARARPLRYNERDRFSEK